ncbi:MAG: hypothetical protein AAFY76_00535, partial [Cyanobacteria bacterium J06649_11]
FFRSNLACLRRIFTERFPGVAAPWAKKNTVTSRTPICDHPLTMWMRATARVFILAYAAVAV